MLSGHWRSRRRQTRRCLISTGDKDMAAAGDPDIAPDQCHEQYHFWPEEVETKYGVPPSLIIDYLALMGDSLR